MANIVDATDTRVIEEAKERTSQSSVREMKMRRSDVGYVDPLAKKNKIDNRFFYSSKNLTAVNPDEIDKMAIKSRIWPWEKSSKTWLEGSDGKAAIKAIQDGTYEFNDPEHDSLWESRAGMLAIGVDPEVVAFYNEFYKRLRARPDFDKIYTPENFSMFWKNFECRRLMIEVVSNHLGLNDDERTALTHSLRYETRKNYAENLDALRTWYKDGGCRYFGAVHYAQTINSLKDSVMQHRNINDLLQFVTPEYFMSLGICSDKNVTSFNKKAVGYVKRFEISNVYQGVVNSDVVTISEEYTRNPEYFMSQTDKFKLKVDKALKSVAVTNIDEIQVYVDEKNNGFYTLLGTGDSSVRFNLTENQVLDLRNSFPGSWAVFDTHSNSVAFNCMNRAEAETWAIAFHDRYNSLVKQTSRGYIQTFELEDLTRVGYLYREGSVAADQNIQCEVYEGNGKGGKELKYKGELLDMCGLAGITFGSTTTLNARTAFVNAVYDSYRDIENVLHIDPKTIFTNLALSYGASGKPPELAHYFYDRDNDTHSININFKNGYGSFAHELIHCLDSELGKRIMKECGLRNNKPSDAPMLSENYYAGDAQWRDALQANYPAAYELVKWISDPSTSYYKKSFSFENPNSDKIYWSASCEMLARAGAIYIDSKFHEMGFRNDFLLGNSHFTAQNSLGSIILAIPNKEEQAIFNGLMDNFLSEVKEKGLIKEVPEINKQSLYAQRHPEQPERYNVIVKEETTPLLHQLEKKARLAKGDKIRINNFDPSELVHAERYVETMLPQLRTRNENVDVSKLKTIIENTETKEFAFGVR